MLKSSGFKLVIPKMKKVQMGMEGQMKPMMPAMPPLPSKK